MSTLAVKLKVSVVCTVTLCQRVFVCMWVGVTYLCISVWRLRGILVAEKNLLFWSHLLIRSCSNTLQRLPLVPLCDSFSPICSLEIGLLNFHEREPSCYEEILMDLQQVINIKPQRFSEVLLSWDVNRINNVENLCPAVSCEVLKNTLKRVFLSFSFWWVGSFWRVKLIMAAHTYTVYWQITGA